MGIRSIPVGGCGCVLYEGLTMVKHNNVIVDEHFRKKWHDINKLRTNVRTWFTQPARQKRRRDKRAAKAAAIFPRPVSGLLRPVVKAPTVKYNMKKRLGRGFTLEELKAAGIPAKLAPTIGICVDHRRRNKCLESLQENAARLKTYKAKLIIFPKNSKKPKAGDAPEKRCAAAEQVKGVVMPIAKETTADVEYVTVTPEMKAFKAYEKLRVERMNRWQWGARKKAAEEKALEEKNKAK